MPMGKWTKLTVNTTTKELDSVCAIMSMLDNGLMIEDYSDFSFNGMYGELVDESILNADKTKAAVSIFIPEEKPIGEYLSFLKSGFENEGLTYKISLDDIDEDHWAENWKQYYKPITLGRVTIVPAWEKYEAKVGEVIIRIDPGMAFGTGTHETTRLVMHLMQNEIKGGERVLDVGTGSGILSICAMKLGAKRCNAYDIDPVAVKVARENVKDSHLEDSITVGVSDLLKNVDLSGGKYDFLVANIVADIIVRMMPDLDNYLNAGAPVILSGIINTSEDKVRDCLKECGYTVLSELRENDWVALVAKKI